MIIWRKLEVPLLVALCAAGVLAPWGGNKTWIAASIWAAGHGFAGLEGGSRAVTSLAAAVAVLGAGLRIVFGWLGGSHFWRAVGLLCVLVPLCLLMPVAGAFCYLAAAVLVVGVGWWSARSAGVALQDARCSWREVLLRESFSVLAAACFLVLGWQYNAQLLMRGLLVAGGIALVARAVLPDSDRVGGRAR